MRMIPPDAIALAQALIQRPSVTPDDHGAIGVVASAAEALGFTCHRLAFQSPGRPRIENLFAHIGSGRPHFSFAGHTDVVPAGARARWDRDPFSGCVHEGMLSGRGAADMKGAIAAFLAAAGQYLSDHQATEYGTISLLITGDEEGDAIDGTQRVLGWLAERSMLPDFCLVGEPTSVSTLGDMIKIGRRGSLTGRITVSGLEGHVAYPHLALNPLPALIDILRALKARHFDDGTADFDPSNLEIVTIDTGNTATNVIPAEARATFNIRFNPSQSGQSLSRWIEDTVRGASKPDKIHAETKIHIGGEPFLTAKGPFTDLVADAVQQATGLKPALSTTGGTSDARFIARHCPVVEFGLPGTTMHKANESVRIADIHALQAIYRGVLARVFTGGRQS